MASYGLHERNIWTAVTPVTAFTASMRASSEAGAISPHATSEGRTCSAFMTNRSSQSGNWRYGDTLLLHRGCAEGKHDTGATARERRIGRIACPPPALCSPRDI